MRALYRMLLWLGLPVLLFRLEWRARREPEYGARMHERLGRVPISVPPGCVWMHAVSAGETIAVAPLIARLANEFSGAGGIPFLVTATTPTGSAQIQARLGDSVHHCYAPYDIPFAVHSFFNAVQPRLLVLVETELWPNIINEANRRGVPIVLINARLSKRSARGYRRLGGLARRMLTQVDTVACQSMDHLQRFQNLGLAIDRGKVLGSVKFDARLARDHDERVATLRQDLNLEQRRVWVAGSTHPGEEEILLAAHTRICNRFSDAALLLVPRHPVRAKELCAMARRRGHKAQLAGLPMSTNSAPSIGNGNDLGGEHLGQRGELQIATNTSSEGQTAAGADSAPARVVLRGVRHAQEPQTAGGANSVAKPPVHRVPANGNQNARSAHPRGLQPADEQSANRPNNAGYSPGLSTEGIESEASVIVWNTMGQLQTLYGLGQVAFLGGSLAPIGGHNPIEAALCGQPLITGPHTWNFAEATQAFEAANCLNRIQTDEQLADAVIAAFANESARIAAGERARRVVRENRGASERLLELLGNHIKALPNHHPQ